jgi:hypothetical protein
MMARMRTWSFYESVRDDVGKAGDDQLSCALHPRGSAKMGMIGQRSDRRADDGVDTCGGVFVILSNKFVD